jgi:S1-C subfamily serine protease
VRTYRFTVAYRNGEVTEVADRRPWLGVIVREGRDGDPTAPLKVLKLANGSPAAGSLHVGDVLLDVLNPPQKARGIFDKLSLLNAGESARLLVDRGGRRVSVSVRLGSLRKALGQYVPEKDYAVEAL